MLTKLMSYFCRRPEDKVGKRLPNATSKITACYAERDLKNMWQGDVYPATAFSAGVLPNAEIPFWMLANRTCHVYFGDKAKSRVLPYLTFIAVGYLSEFIDTTKGSIKNQVTDVIKQNEKVLFLPESINQGISSPLLVNFGLIYSFRNENCPTPTTKVLQLSSPFAEHAFQKFASYFYTVGFDDSQIKDPLYISSLVAKLST